MSSAVLRIPLLFAFLQLTTCIFAVPCNITVDDTNGDASTHGNVSYSPPGFWYSTQACATCSDPCEAPCPNLFFEQNPDLGEIVDSTWHVSFFNSESSPSFKNATVAFRGTAIYAYCILNAGLVNSNMIFYLDGEQVGTYTYNFVNSTDTPYHYSVPVFQLGSLSNDNHTFTVANGQDGAGNGRSSLVLLDYFEYTTDLDEEADPSPSPSVTPSITQEISAKSRDIIVAVATVAGLLLMAIVLVVIYFKRRLRYHGLEKITSNYDKSSQDEDFPLSDSTESVPPNAPDGGVEHRLLSPSRRTSVPENTNNQDGVPQTSCTPANQPSDGAAQLVKQTVMSGTSSTPAFVSIPSSMGIRAGRAPIPIPPPGVPILDGPPPSPGLLGRIYAASSAMEGSSSRLNESARKIFEGRQYAAGTSGSNQPSDELVREEASERLRSPPPGYVSRAGSICGDSS